MKPAEQAAVEAAVVAVRAAEATDGQFRGARPDELLSARLDGLRRANGRTEPEGGKPDAPKARGAKYAEKYSPTRERLSRAQA